MKYSPDCAWCHVEAEAQRMVHFKPPFWGPNCPRHSDNIKAAQTIFGALAAQEKGTMTQYLKRPGLIGTVLMLAAIACLFGCALTQDKEIRPAVVDAISGETNTPAVMGKFVPEATKTAVRGIGSAFGPIGDAVAECGLAVVALLVAGFNHRKLSKHLADSPGTIASRVSRPRAPAAEPAT